MGRLWGLYSGVLRVGVGCGATLTGGICGLMSSKKCIFLWSLHCVMFSLIAQIFHARFQHLWYTIPDMYKSDSEENLKKRVADITDYSSICKEHKFARARVPAHSLIATHSPIERTSARTHERTHARSLAPTRLRTLKLQPPTPARQSAH